MLVIEKIIVNPEKRGKLFGILWMILTLLIVNFGWVIFNSVSLKEAGHFILAMFGKYTDCFGRNDVSVYLLLREYGVYILFGILFATPVAKYFSKRFSDNYCGSYIKGIILPVVYIAIFLWAMSFLILGAHNPFIYFNF